jgi:hypothetical protein
VPASPPSLDALFVTRPAEFTAARKALLAHLRQGNQASEAAAVEKLPRLTLPVWAINTAARQDHPGVARLVEAAERVRDAQLGGRSTQLEGASAAYRAALSHMEEGAVAQLRAAGDSVPAAVRLRIGRTLTAAVAGPATRAALRQGRLSRELPPTGFDVFGQGGRALRLVSRPRQAPVGRAPAAQPPAAATSAPPEPARRARQLVRLRTAVAAAAADLRRLEAQVRALEKTATRHARTATEAQERADAARQAAERLQPAVERARIQLTSAERALEAAPTPD